MWASQWRAHACRARGRTESESPKSKLLHYTLNIFEPSNAHAAVHKAREGELSGLSFLSLLGYTPSQVFFLSRTDSFQKWYYSRRGEKQWDRVARFYSDYTWKDKKTSEATFINAMLRVATRANQAATARPCPIAGAAKGLSCSRRLSGSPAGRRKSRSLCATSQGDG